MRDFLHKLGIGKHTFRKVGRAKKGLTLEKYVECTRCGKTVIVINVHPDLWIAYERLPKPLYFERTQLKRRKKNEYSITDHFNNELCRGKQQRSTAPL